METLKEKFEKALDESGFCIIHWGEEHDSETKIYEDECKKVATELERIAIQSQIELLKEETERLELQSKGLKELLKPSSMSNNRIEGKRSGLKIAIENLRQSIKSLESQLNKE